MAKQKRKSRQFKYGFSFPENIEDPISFGISSSGSNDLKTFITTLDGKKYYLDAFNRTVSYDGEKKEKVILSQPISTQEEILINPLYEMLQYDLIVVIDTNYKIINLKKYASTCWLICEKVKASGNCYHITTYEYNWIATGEDKPENVMYANIIDKIDAHRNKKKLLSRIAVVVDSDLDKVHGFNSRLEPIYANYFLPEAFKMFYASAERGTTEYFENSLMHTCDKEAEDSLNNFIQSELS